MDKNCREGNHPWNDCVCMGCGATRHQLDGCECILCHGFDHVMKDCTCTRCGVVMPKGRHRVPSASCTCSVCGMGVHSFKGVTCARCGHLMTDDEALEELVTLTDPLTLLGTFTAYAFAATKLGRGTPKGDFGSLVVPGMKPIPLNMATLGQSCDRLLTNLQSLIRELDARDKGSEESRSELRKRRLTLYHKVGERVGMPDSLLSERETILRGFGKGRRNHTDPWPGLVLNVLSRVGEPGANHQLVFSDAISKLLPDVMKEMRLSGESKSNVGQD